MSFNVAGINVSKTVGYIFIAFVIGWLCGCRDINDTITSDYDTIRNVKSGAITFEVICIGGTEYYNRLSGSASRLAPVIIDGVFVSCK